MNKKFKRVFTIVLDSCGIGNGLDAKVFGDENSDTLGHIDANVDHLIMPNMEKLGLGNLKQLKHIKEVENPLGYYVKLNEASASKDTMAGHWEMMGINTEKPFKTFKHFPSELITALEKETGRKVIGNKACSGTTILDELANEEINDPNKMIVYTSADSVLQICGHEEVSGLDELYRCCEIARKLTFDERFKIGRVIARPYIGNVEDGFKRTANRKDYALKPPYPTALNILKDAGYQVISVGKISDIFNGEGISESIHSDSSAEGMKQTIDLVDRDFEGLCFTNLVDFDAKWGHRRNVEGYRDELEKFDVLLGELLDKLHDDDLLLITADHGNDPTYSGTDHTREQVMLLAYSKKFNKGNELKEQSNFGCIGATILDNFGLSLNENLIGDSLLDELGE